MTPLVVDLYHGNVVYDFAEVKAAGIIGVIHKASQGLLIVDGAYASRRSAALHAGLLWGAYHFMSLDDPIAQAHHFLSVADPDDKTLVCLDWELTQPSETIARVFLTEIQNALNRSAVLYSGATAKEQITGNDPFFGAHRLWLAEYGPSWKVQESWKAPWLWQYSENGVIRGLRNPTDVSTVPEGVDPGTIAAEWAA
jgi:GH25 family lysozyme M1 (1,4-beta-N-acetylmuramidase)